MRGIFAARGRFDGVVMRRSEGAAGAGGGGGELMKWLRLALVQCGGEEDRGA